MVRINSALDLICLHHVVHQSHDSIQDCHPCEVISLSIWTQTLLFVTIKCRCKIFQNSPGLVPPTRQQVFVKSNRPCPHTLRTRTELLIALKPNGHKAPTGEEPLRHAQTDANADAVGKGEHRETDKEKGRNREREREKEDRERERTREGSRRGRRDRVGEGSRRMSR